MKKRSPMKYKTLAILALGLNLPLSPAFAGSEGGKDGGGGDVRSSTRAEVLDSLKRILKPEVYTGDPSNLYEFFFTQTLVRDRKAIPDPGVNGILDSMLEGMDTSALHPTMMEPVTPTKPEWSQSVKTNTNPHDVLAENFWKTPVAEDIRASKIRIQETNACPVPVGEPKNSAASTMFKRNAEICLYLPKLMLISKVDLDRQLRGVLIHEITHHFGFGEKDANLLQNYSLAMNGKNNNADREETELRILAGDFENKIGTWVHEIDSARERSEFTGKPAVPVRDDGSICLEIGALNKLTAMIYSTIRLGSYRASETAVDNKKALPLALKLGYRTSSMLGYCTAKPVIVSFYDSPTDFTNYPLIRKGDRASLEKTLRVLHAEARAFETGY